MRYERRGPDPGADRRWSTKRRRVAVALGAIAVLTGGTLGGLIASRPDHRVVLVPAVVTPFLEANELMENLGTPTPVGLSGASWALDGDPLARGSGPTRLEYVERAWVDSSGRPLPLSPPVAAGLVAVQDRLVRTVFTGEAATQALHDVRVLVEGETQAVPTPSPPGGARIVSWYSLTVKGTHASADALVALWEQHDSYASGTTGRRIDSSIVTDEIEAKATLVRVEGTWRVASLDELPWQEAT